MQSCYDCYHLKAYGESIYCMWNGKDKGVKIDEETERGTICEGFCPKKKIDRSICKHCANGTWFGSELYCIHIGESLLDDGTCEKHESVVED